MPMFIDIVLTVFTILALAFGRKNGWLYWPAVIYLSIAATQYLLMKYS